MPETAPAIPKGGVEPTGETAGVTQPVSPTPDEPHVDLSHMAVTSTAPTPEPVNPFPFEMGRKTSEAAGLIATFILAVLGVLASFGHGVTGAQQTAIIGVAISACALASGLYSIGRSVRKAGLTK